MKKINDEILFIDGYNLINNWDILKKEMDISLEDARDKLIYILNEYASMTRRKIILVFDAYKKKGGIRNKIQSEKIIIIYTKELETADNYIEKKIRTLMDTKNEIYVVTDDSLEQIMALGSGAIRMTTSELKADYQTLKSEISRKKKRYIENINDSVIDEKKYKQIKKLIENDF